MIKHRPADKADEAPGVAEKLEMLVKQATSEKPNRKWYSVSAEGLLDASKWTKNFAGNLVGTVGQLGKMLRPDFSLPKGESRGGVRLLLRTVGGYCQSFARRPNRRPEGA